MEKQILQPLGDAWKAALCYQSRIWPANMVGPPKVFEGSDDERARVDLVSPDAVAR
jgi:hypothetical protein